MCLQALSYIQGSKTRYMVRLQLHEPASCSLPALLQLRQGKAGAAAATAAQQTGSHGGGNGQVASAVDDAESQHDAGNERHAEVAHRRSSE
jgi:hypothetical protein